MWSVATTTRSSDHEIKSGCLYILVSITKNHSAKPSDFLLGNVSTYPG